MSGAVITEKEFEHYNQLKQDFEDLKLINKGLLTHTVFRSEEFREILTPMIEVMQYYMNTQCTTMQDEIEPFDLDDAICECPNVEKYEEAAEKMSVAFAERNKKFYSEVEHAVIKVMKEGIAQVEADVKSILEELAKDEEDISIEDYLPTEPTQEEKMLQ